jgi:hypothetical protein
MQAKLQGICILLMLAIVAYGGMGCIDQVKNENKTVAPSVVPASSFMETPNPGQNQCPVSRNTTQFIIINPVGNHTIGDVFEINGTTSFGVDSKLRFSVAPPPRINTASTVLPEHYSTFEDYVTLRNGSCGINSWSASVNLSGFDPVGRSFKGVTYVELWVWDMNYFDQNRSQFIITTTGKTDPDNSWYFAYVENTTTKQDKMPFKILQLTDPDFPKNHISATIEELVGEGSYIPAEEARRIFNLTENKSQKDGGELHVSINLFRRSEFKKSSDPPLPDVIAPFATRIDGYNGAGENMGSINAWIPMNDIEKIAALPDVYRIALIGPPGSYSR